VTTHVPKVTKMPVEMRMLCYQNQNEDTNVKTLESSSENKPETNKTSIFNLKTLL
jgi:hypothetical protein